MSAAEDHDAVDGEIVRLAKARDVRGAATLLAKTYKKRVRDYVRRRVRADTVDDVCGKVWAVIAAGIPDDLNSPCGYVIGIARNKIGHALDERSFVKLDSALAEQPMWRSASRSTRSKLILAQEIEEARQAIAALDSYDRELITLSFVEGLRPAEIAVALGRRTDPKTVSKQISRIVDGLRGRIIRR